MKFRTSRGLTRLRRPAAVSFFFAGNETEYSGLIRDHGDYFKMLNDLMDDLADVADAIPTER